LLATLGTAIAALPAPTVVPLDLKKALDAGAINQQEYERLRKKILED
jgi:putative oligomerization/nucleic acid binding protein